MTDFVENTRQTELLAETSKIAWKELQYFFASGKAIYVATELDLINIAAHIAADNTDVVEGWMQSTQIAPVSNDQARTWYENDTIVWAVVVKPWVLVQEVTNSPARSI